MDFVFTFLKHFVMGCGFVSGVVATFALFIWIKEKYPIYKARDLVEPFENYLEKLKKKEADIQIKDVNDIIEVLQSGKIPKCIYEYEIEADLMLETTEDRGKSKRRLRTIYIVHSKKNKGTKVVVPVQVK